jgi:SAM-dependent methyltransferase
LRRFDQDVGFWLEQARRGGGFVLELACGTGRITTPLARHGVPIVGLDNDPAMLRAAQRHAGPGPGAGAGAGAEAGGASYRPLFVAADMRQFALACRFQLVFVAYNSLQLLTTPADTVACLTAARQHLAAGGLVGVEVTDFQGGGADDDDSPSRDLVPLADAEGIHLSGNLVHDLKRRISRYRRHFTGEGWEVDNEVVVQSIDRPELSTLLAVAALEPVQWWEAGASIRTLARPLP